MIEKWNVRLIDFGRWTIGYDGKPSQLICYEKYKRLININ